MSIFSQSNVAVLGGVVSGAGHDVDAPVAEHAELVGEQERGEVQGEDVPEVAVEEPREADVPGWPVPQRGDGLAIVAFPGVHAVLLGPEVHHVAGRVHEGVRKHGAQVGGQTRAEDLHGRYWVVSGSPDHGQLVNQPVIAVEAGEGQERVLDVKWQGVAEQVVRSLLEWDATEGVEVAGVALLEVTREGAVGVVGSEHHVAGHCERRSHEEGAEDSGDLPVVAVFEAAEVALPAGVELPEGGQLEADVEEGAEEGELTGVAHGLVEGLETGHRVEPGLVLRGVDWGFVVLGEQLGAVDEVGDVLLEVGGDESDHYAFVRTELPRWQFQAGVESTAVCQPVTLFRPNVGCRLRRMSSNSKNITLLRQYYNHYNPTKPTLSICFCNFSFSSVQQLVSYPLDFSIFQKLQSLYFIEEIALDLTQSQQILNTSRSNKYHDQNFRPNLKRIKCHSMVRIQQNQLHIHYPCVQWYNQIMMKACFASFNTKGFSSALSNPYQNHLPAETHITYDGCFNELKYSIGPKAKKRMELYLGYARAQNSQSFFDPDINNFLTIFTKGSKDGEDRDDRVLNAVIVLDVSGSMGGALTSKGTGNRLELAKEAILMFFSKLRPNDGFGLVIFHNSAKTLIPLQRASSIQFAKVSETLKQVKASGGTTLITGFQQSLNEMKSYLAANQAAKESQYENRFIIMTDVEDNSVAHSKNFVQEISNSEIHTTIIGISDSFKSQVCQELSQVKGFNYFCATEVDDLKKYLFENFSFTFFPDTYDIEISLKNDNVKSIQVFGTNDSAKVPLYNVKSVDNFTVTKSKTSFPSQLEIGEDGSVKTYGGLVLVKLNLKDKEKSHFQGAVHLKYRTSDGEHIEQDYPFKYASPSKEQFYSDQSLYEALSGFFYVHEVKNVLKAVKEQGDKPETRKKFVEPLKKLKALAPKSKHEELDNLIKKFDNSPKQTPVLM